MSKNLYDFDTIIDMQPTVEAEPVKHGRWVFDDENGGYRCSVCKTLGGKSDYCPNCGAKMDGREND